MRLYLYGKWLMVMLSKNICKLSCMINICKLKQIIEYEKLIDRESKLKYENRGT